MNYFVRVCKVMPAAVILLSFAFSMPSLLKIYGFAHGFTSQKEGVHLLGSVLLLGNIRYCTYWCLSTTSFKLNSGKRNIDSFL